MLTQYRIYLGLASRQIYSRNRRTRSDQFPCHLGIVTGAFVTVADAMSEPSGWRSMELFVLSRQRSAVIQKQLNQVAMANRLAEPCTRTVFGQS